MFVAGLLDFDLKRAYIGTERQILAKNKLRLEAYFPTFSLQQVSPQGLLAQPAGSDALKYLAPRAYRP